MTSFQRLLRGLNVLNRYSGVTDVHLLSFVDDSDAELMIHVPSSIKVDAKDVDALAKMGWDQSDHNWTFQP